MLVLSLGCEKLQPERLLPEGVIPVAVQGSSCGPDVLRLQDEQHIGFMAMVEAVMQRAVPHLERLNERRRETVPASELVVGVQCGGSDAFSGVTANPAVGYCTDLLVRAGATVMFSETTEVRDAVDQLTARAADASVAEAIRREMAWYDDYLTRGGVDRSANTTPGNKKGGLSNIVEKAMGSIVKSGTMMNTTSAWRVTSSAVAQAMAEEALIASGNGPMVLTNSACPASIRCSAIGRPMTPRPMQPRRSPGISLRRPTGVQAA